MALAGDLADVSSSELLSLLTRRGATGALVIRRASEDATLAFEAGRLVAVTSAAASLHLEAWLSHPCRVSAAQAAALVDQPADSPLPLGARLRCDRLMVVDGLADMLASQAETILAQVLGWPDGEFRFEPWPDPPAQRRRPTLDTARLIYAVAGTDRLAPRLSRRPATGVVKIVRLTDAPSSAGDGIGEPSLGAGRQHQA